jgi:hypothetical protein
MIKIAPPVDATSDHVLGPMNTHLDFLERLFIEKFNARDRALTVAMTAMDVRLDSMNEFRNTLRDQAALFVTRDEYLTAHAAVVRNIESMRIELSTSVVRIEQSDRASAVERAQLDKRLDAMNEFRLQLKDQAATLMSRSEVTALFIGLQEDVKRLEIAASEKAGRDDSAAAFDRIDIRLKLVEGKLATWDGRRWALGTIFLLINIFVSWWLSGLHGAPH